ncbi:MAG: hypothetical protein J4G01_09020 [Dehalococcoidia bacterium]|nr:hypothetical protein [Dehalococcoidia bacterium]
MRTSEAVNIYKAGRRGRVSPRTFEGYHYRLRVFERYFPGALPDKPEEIDEFLANLEGSPETLDTYFRLLRAFYRLLLKRGYVTASPMSAVEKPRLARKVYPSLSVKELRIVLTIPDMRTEIRAMLLLLLDTGIRVSEALSLNREALGPDYMIVAGKTGQRLVPISTEVSRLVSSSLPWPWLTRRGVLLALKKTFAKVGIVGKKATTKALRHTFMRMWEGDLSSLRDIAGWTSMRMVQVYRPYNLERAKAQHRVYRPLKRLGVAQLQLF